MIARLLLGHEQKDAHALIARHHYTHSIPSGKTYTFAVEPAVVLISIPANKNIAGFLGVKSVWELSRLWAPDGHEKNLLTQAISASVRVFKRMEPTVDCLVSYADPNVGHLGGVYRAASWIHHGQSGEGRYYIGRDGQPISRRAFHSGSRSLKKAEILALGFTEVKRSGKIRFVFPLNRRARRIFV